MQDLKNFKALEQHHIKTTFWAMFWDCVGFISFLVAAFFTMLLLSV